MLTIGSLFSGIGGLELGLEWSGLGPVLWQVEKDPFCRSKLFDRYPNAIRFSDVRDVDPEDLPYVDLICGGFPCQDVSSAGKRAGIAGARSGLWYEFSRIVASRRPPWVVVENVRSGAVKWVPTVRRALERHGYATLPIPIAASDCGAPHERARVFIVARLAAHGHYQKLASPNDGGRRASELARASSDARSEFARIKQGGAGRKSGRNTPEPAWALAHAHDAARDVRNAARPGLPHVARHSGWSVEPEVARVVHGLPGRMAYERALGNSVVPQCAEVVGHVILQLIKEAS